MLEFRFRQGSYLVVRNDSGLCLLETQGNIWYVTALEDDDKLISSELRQIADKLDELNGI